ncbi:hypothetical protein ACQ4PT_038045 [Festuca glaucescens]
MIRMSDSDQRLPDDLVTGEILTRLPAAAAIRFPEVYRAWNAAITSDHFVAAHARRAAARQPEILFFPPAEGPSTSFYTCSVAQGRRRLPRAPHRGQPRRGVRRAVPEAMPRVDARSRRPVVGRSTSCLTSPPATRRAAAVRAGQDFQYPDL